MYPWWVPKYRGKGCNEASRHRLQLEEFVFSKLTKSLILPSPTMFLSYGGRKKKNKLENIWWTFRRVKFLRYSVVETRENTGERTFIDFEVLKEMETRNSSRVLEKRNSDHLKSEFEEEVLGWKRMGHRDSNSPLPIFFF